MTKFNKTELKKSIIEKLGNTQDATMVYDALTTPDSYLYSEYQVRAFQRYAKAFGIALRLEHEDFYYKVVSA